MRAIMIRSFAFGVTLLLILVLLGDVTGSGMPCTISDLSSCGETEICVQKAFGDTTGICQCHGADIGTGVNCTSEYPYDEHTEHHTAQPHTDKSSSSAVVAGTIIPLLLVCAAVAGLVYFGRRHNWLHRLRQLRPLQRSNDVLIGRDDDDEPIA